MLRDFFARSALAKVLMLVLLTSLLGIPLALIGGVIQERGQSRWHAAQSLAAAHAGPQTVIGPVLLVPYVERWTEEKRDAEGKLTSRVSHARQKAHLVFPETTVFDGRLEPQERYRGIFKVLFYEWRGGATGRFSAFDPSRIPHAEKDSVIEAQAPLFALGLRDVRGLQGTPVLELAGQATSFQPRPVSVPADSWLADGIHAPLPAAAAEALREGRAIPFRLQLALVGQERIAFVPLADDTRANLSSPWPHPSFGGEFLARERSIGAQGFSASWAVTSLVSRARNQVVQPRRAESQDSASLQSFDVSLVEPQNVHSLSERAVKYGLLFVALVLMAAFMFELFARLRLHPVQYGLVGLAIAVFFLLLLALSEKMAFGLAYGLAAGASVALLTAYFSAVLRGLGRGVGLGAFVAVLYGVLYGLLSSEDNALLLGSLLLFGLLALLMLGTRRVDWYALSAREPAA